MVRVVLAAAGLGTTEGDSVGGLSGRRLSDGVVLPRMVDNSS